MDREWGSATSGSTAIAYARAEKRNAPTVRIHAEHRKDATSCHNVTERDTKQTLHFIHAIKCPHYVFYIFSDEYCRRDSDCKDGLYCDHGRYYGTMLCNGVCLGESPIA